MEKRSGVAVFVNNPMWLSVAAIVFAFVSSALLCWSTGTAAEKKPKQYAATLNVGEGDVWLVQEFGLYELRVRYDKNLLSEVYLRSHKDHATEIMASRAGGKQGESWIYYIMCSTQVHEVGVPCPGELFEKNERILIGMPNQAAWHRHLTSEMEFLREAARNTRNYEMFRAAKILLLEMDPATITLTEP